MKYKKEKIWCFLSSLPLFLLSTTITPRNMNCTHICLTFCIGGGGTEVIDETKEKARSQRSVLMALKVS